GQPGFRGERIPDPGDRVVDKTGAAQQRLTAVQNDLDIGYLMHGGMLGDPARGAVQRLGRNDPGLAAPRRIGHLVDVAISACRITATVQLQDELAEWPRRPAVAEKGPDVQPFGRPARTRWRPGNLRWRQRRSSPARRRGATRRTRSADRVTATRSVTPGRGR